MKNFLKTAGFILSRLMVIVAVLIIFIVIKMIQGAAVSPDLESALDEIDIGDLTEEEEEAEYTGPDEAVIAFTGTACYTQEQLNLASRKDQTYNFNSMFGNLNTALKDSAYCVTGSRVPVYNTGFVGEAVLNNPDVQFNGELRTFGARLIAAGNQSMLEAGQEAWETTVTLAEKLKLKQSGIFVPEDSHHKNGNIYIRDIHHISFAFLSYGILMTDKELSGAGVSMIGMNKGIVAEESRTRVIQDIAAARNCGAEIVCVYIDWNGTVDHEDLLKLFEENGADAVIGTGCGLPETFGMKSCRGADGTERNVFVAEDIGFLFGETKQGVEQEKIVLYLNVKRDDSGKAYISYFCYLPIYCVVPSDSEDNYELLNVYRQIEKIEEKLEEGKKLTDSDRNMQSMCLTVIESLQSRIGKNLDYGTVLYPAGESTGGEATTAAD